MKLDPAGAYITRAVKAGPHDSAQILIDGLEKTTERIFALFDDLSAADIPLMIAALRFSEQALSNCSIAKETNAILAADAISKRFCQKISESHVAVPQGLIDLMNDKQRGD